MASWLLFLSITPDFCLGRELGLGVQRVQHEAGAKSAVGYGCLSYRTSRAMLFIFWLASISCSFFCPPLIVAILSLSVVRICPRLCA